MPHVNCPVCRRRLRVPDHLAGRRVSCPKCSEPLRVPVPEPPPEEAESSPESEPEPLPVPVRLGMISLALGLVGVLVLCLPFIGLISVGLSGVGLLLGLGGVHQSFRHGDRVFGPLAGGTRGITRFGQGTLDYPVAGIAACLAALTLSLLPFLIR